jgi:flagellar motor protein MotB
MEFARPGRRAGMVALIAAWVVVAAAAVAVGAGGIEDELSREAQLALADSGVTVDDLRVEGRDVVVAASPDARAGVEAALGDLAGVRTVRFVALLDGSIVAGDSNEPSDAAQSDEASPTSVAPPTGPEPSTTTAAPPDGVAYLSASLRDGRVVIEGAIPDPQIAARVTALAELVYSPLLQNDLTVDESLAGASWVPNTAAIVTRLPIVGTSSVRVVGDQAEISGLAPTEARLAQFLGAMQQALGPDVSVTSDVEVTGFDPPFVRAEAPGDGTIRLTGTMPSLDVVRLIAGTAIEVFGAGAVVNELEVGENIDTTFSLFRLPLAFVAFEPVPQWEVTIDDDVITGSLRGGATFPSGSARLTPELLALMPVAAGILARNPTLGMIIEGHTDSIGGDEDNLLLSVDRAEAARAWLIEAGIEADRVVAVGYGETRPIGDNQTSEGRALNRRVEFVLAPASALGDQG